MRDGNASFHMFKPSGKWANSGRGYLSADVFNAFDQHAQSRQILSDNGGNMPGISSGGWGYTVVVIGDDNLAHGWPLHLNFRAISE